MTTRSFTKKDKKGREETWEWEETPDVIKALDRLHQNMRENSEQSSTTK